MKTTNQKELKCDSCDQGNYLEFNHDASYVMCMYCLREYKGGYEELSLLNENKTSNLKIERAFKEEEIII